MKKHKRELMLWGGILIPILILILVLVGMKDTLFSQEPEPSKLASVAFEPKDTAGFTSGTKPAETRVVFTTTTAVAGEPLEVTIENGPEDLSDWTYSWQVDEEPVKDNKTSSYT